MIIIIVTAKVVKPKLDAPLFPSRNPHLPKQKTPLDSLCSVQLFTFKNKKKHSTKVVHMKIKEEREVKKLCGSTPYCPT